MGTRHVTAVVLDGEYKVAQYGQWDGYPDGQGTDILRFLTSIMQRSLFETKLRAARFGTEQEIKDQWTSVGADPNNEWVTMDISEAHERMYPENSRDTGAGVLEIVQNKPAGIMLHDSLSFVADGLFCEWAYVIDLDRNTFEVFEGFQKKPLGNGERFYFLQKEESEYYPAKLKAAFPLSNLPPMVTFLAKFAADEDNDSDELSGMEPQLSRS